MHICRSCTGLHKNILFFKTIYGVAEIVFSNVFSSFKITFHISKLWSFLLVFGMCWKEFHYLSCTYEFSFLFIHRDNDLTDLPVDIFRWMPSIKYVFLERNKITTLDERTWSPIWQQLNGVSLDGEITTLSENLWWKYVIEPVAEKYVFGIAMKMCMLLLKVAVIGDDYDPKGVFLTHSIL